jgi:hypothetical protein
VPRIRHKKNDMERCHRRNGTTKKEMERIKKTNINECPGGTEVEVGIGIEIESESGSGSSRSRDRDRDSGDVKWYGVRGVPLTITPPLEKHRPDASASRCKRWSYCL